MAGYRPSAPRAKWNYGRPPKISKWPKAKKRPEYDSHRENKSGKPEYDSRRDEETNPFESVTLDDLLQHRRFLAISSRVATKEYRDIDEEIQTRLDEIAKKHKGWHWQDGKRVSGDDEPKYGTEAFKKASKKVTNTWRFKKVTPNKEEVDIFDEARKAVSWNPPEVQAKAAKEKKERRMFASAKREIGRQKRKEKHKYFIGSIGKKRYYDQ